jgi:hypothetical protein
MPIPQLFYFLKVQYLLFSHDLFHDQRTAVNAEILFDIFVCIFKTVANKIAHAQILQKPMGNGLTSL